MRDELPGFEPAKNYVITTPSGRQYLMKGYGNPDLALDAALRCELRQCAREDLKIEEVGR